MQVGPNLDIETVGSSYAPEVSQWYDSITGHYYKSDSVNGTSQEDSMGDLTINFKVPDDNIATINVTLTVDDWGHFDLFSANDPQTTILHLGMMKNVDASPGPRGGHTIWSKSGTVQLLPGDYRMVIYHENATYVPEYAHEVGSNVAQCDFAISATKVPACVINWPTSDVLFSTPINWYERVVLSDSSSSTGYKAYRWNWGTILGLTPEQFKAIAKGIYAESTSAEHILFEGHSSTSPKALTPSIALDEMKAIASAMINRIGNSAYAPYRKNTVVTDITKQFGTQQFPFTDNEAYKEDMKNDQYVNKPGLVCKKFRLCIEALYFIMENGTPYVYDKYVTGDKAELPADTYDTIGNTKFYKEKQYFDSRTKPVAPQPDVEGGWDDWEIASNSPMNK